MQADPQPIRTRTAAALRDATLKLAIERTTGTAERKRAALAYFPEFEAARERGTRVKDHIVVNLDHSTW